MNRSQRLTTPKWSSSGASAGPSFSLDAALFSPPGHDASRALFAPVHYEPNYAYPLLIWLHGPGNDEWQLMRIMPLVSMRNYVAVAPRGFRAFQGDVEREGWGWSQHPEHIQEAEHRVFESIEAAQRKFHIASHRVFLAGFDCGGTMAFRVAMSHPSWFAGVLSVGGAFPRGDTPFGQWTLARRLSVFLAVGRDSQEYPPAQACDDLRLFHAAGISVTLRQYPCGHQLSPHMLGDMDRWIIEQIIAPVDASLPVGHRR